MQRHRCSETQDYGIKLFSVLPMFRNHSPRLSTQEYSAMPGESWLPQLVSTNAYKHEEKGKTQRHLNHGAKSLAAKHRPEIILREFIGRGRCLVCSNISQLSLQLQRGFRTEFFSAYSRTRAILRYPNSFASVTHSVCTCFLQLSGAHGQVLAAAVIYKLWSFPSIINLHGWAIPRWEL